MYKKILFSIALLVLMPLSAKAEQLFGFMDHKFYDTNAVLQVFGFMDGKYYNLTGQEVWLVNGNFTTTAPTSKPDALGVPIIDSAPAPTNVLFPQPTILPPSSAPIIIPSLSGDVCPNLDGVQPSLPQGMVIVNGQCVSLNDPSVATANVPTQPYVSNLKVDAMGSGGLINFLASVSKDVMPKIEFSLNADMSNSQIEKQRRDDAGNTIDFCPGHDVSSVGLSLSPGYGLLPNTTYYFRLKAYQCRVPNYNPFQLFLGNGDIISTTTLPNI